MNFRTIFFDKFQKDYWVGMSFGTPLESRKKDEFVNQKFLTNGSGLIHKKRSSKNQRFNFPSKIYEIQEKILNTKLFISKRSTNFLMTIFS